MTRQKYSKNKLKNLETKRKRRADDSYLVQYFVKRWKFKKNATGNTFRGNEEYFLTKVITKGLAITWVH